MQLSNAYKNHIVAAPVVMEIVGILSYAKTVKGNVLLSVYSNQWCSGFTNVFTDVH